MSKATIEERKSMQMNINQRKSFLERKSRGQLRATFNETVARLPGVYNPDAKVEVVEIQGVEPYDKFNLTVFDRATHSQS